MSVPVSIFEKIITNPSAIARQKAAPLANEREAFLEYLLANGRRIESMGSDASGLLQVIKFLRLNRLRFVTPAEIRRARHSLRDA